MLIRELERPADCGPSGNRFLDRAGAAKGKQYGSGEDENGRRGRDQDGQALSAHDPFIVLLLRYLRVWPKNAASGVNDLFEQSGILDCFPPRYARGRNDDFFVIARRPKADEAIHVSVIGRTSAEPRGEIFRPGSKDDGNAGASGPWIRAERGGMRAIVARWCGVLCVGALAAGLVWHSVAFAQVRLGTFPNSQRIINGAKSGSLYEVRSGILEGGSVNARDSAGSPVLAVAAAQGETEILKLLLDNGANANLAGSDGRTALHEASKRGDPEAVALLLARGADANVMDREGRTPLSLAAESGSAAAVRTLLASGADPGRADYSGREPLDWAREGRSPAVTRALEEAEKAE